jgi:hypothetical protein
VKRKKTGDRFQNKQTKAFSGFTSLFLLNAFVFKQKEVCMRQNKDTEMPKAIKLFGETEEVEEVCERFEGRNEIPEGVVPIEKIEAVEWDRWLSYEEIHKSVLCFVGGERDDRGRVFLPVEIWLADTKRWRKAKLGYAYFLALMKGGLLKVGDCVYCEYTGEKKLAKGTMKQFRIMRIGVRKEER